MNPGLLQDVSLQEVLERADCLFSREQVEAALEALVPALERDFADKNPLVIAVMNGALPTAGYLLPRLGFRLEQDYIHASRYGNGLQGAELVWKVKPEAELRGRHLLLVDDVLDRGITLAAIRDYCLEQGAACVKVLVLAEKQIAGLVPPIAADYRALYLPDRFVFGYGMDYQGYWRNAPGIYAL